MSEKSVQELAYELSEKRLASQLTAALAADARAMSFAATMVAAAAILAGLSKESAAPTAMLLGAILVLLSAAIAAVAAKPTKFYMPGAKYSDLEEDIKVGATYTDTINEIGSHNDLNSRENDKILGNNADRLRWAFYSALLGALVAVVPQFDTSDAENVAQQSLLLDDRADIARASTPQAEPLN